MRRAAFPVALALVAMAAAAGAWWSWREPAATGAAVTAPRTPVLSARRVPAVLSGTAADARLRRDLDAAVADPALGGARAQLCLAVDAGDGHPLYGFHQDQMLLPASNMKLLTATAALAVLGPTTTLRTDIRAAAKPDEGVVAGNLWMVGGGDPLLATADYIQSLRRPHAFTPMEALADRIVAAGVRQIAGSVVGDESRFDTQRYLPTWKRTYISDNEIGPESALTVNDNFSSFKPKVIAAASPAASAAETLTNLLKVRGVQVAGPPTAGTAPAGAVSIAFVDSPPVSGIVEQMLRESDNMTAELLVKEIDRRSGGPGATASGVAAARRALQKAGVPVDRVFAVDASGLDRSDRASCSVLLRAVERAGKASALARGLPVAGQDGTLQDRFKGTPVAGKVRAKTGSLDGVSALTGYVTTKVGDLTFSLVANALPRDALGVAFEARVASTLVAYPAAPPAAELGPLR